MRIKYDPETTGEGHVMLEHSQLPGGMMSFSTLWAKVYMLQLMRAILAAEDRKPTVANLRSLINEIEV